MQVLYMAQKDRDNARAKTIQMMVIQEESEKTREVFGGER